MGTENKGLEVSTLEMAMAQKWRGGCGHSGYEPEEGTRGSYQIIDRNYVGWGRLMAGHPVLSNAEAERFVAKQPGHSRHLFKPCHRHFLSLLLQTGGERAYPPRRCQKMEEHTSQQGHFLYFCVYFVYTSDSDHKKIIQAVRGIGYESAISCEGYFLTFPSHP